MNKIDLDKKYINDDIEDFNDDNEFDNLNHESNIKNFFIYYLEKKTKPISLSLFKNRVTHSN